MFGAKQFGVQQNSVQKDYQFQKVFGPILVSKCSGSKKFWVKITLCLELFEFRKKKGWVRHGKCWFSSARQYSELKNVCKFK